MQEVTGDVLRGLFVRSENFAEHCGKVRCGRAFHGQTHIGVFIVRELDEGFGGLGVSCIPERKSDLLANKWLRVIDCCL